MRDTKSLLLLLVSLLLVLVSFVLILTWGYNFYSKNEVVKANVMQSDTDSAAIVNSVSDSMQKVYSATLLNLDNQLNSTLTNSDYLNNQLDVKLAEFYRLRNEIAEIVKARNPNNNYTVARQKIGELQSKVDDLKEKNQVVDKENKKLYGILNDIGRTEKAGDKTIQTPKIVNNNNSEKGTPVFSAFTASDLRLSAVNNTGENETETNVAEKTNKLAGTFTVMNFNSQLTHAEMVVVVIMPDGKVLKRSGWDSGTFNTPEGKKIYSYKFNFVYSRGEAKQLAFTLRGGVLIRGNYTMEVYHSGLMIGKIVKALS